ncbi:MAG: SMC family ATPase, partial [Clostridiales bacterium]|nr:SMC family ATPase [Clostridiales bacterium]
QLKERLEKYRQNKEKAAQLLKDAEIRLTEVTAQIKNLQDSLIYETKEAATRELAATHQQMQLLEQAMTNSAKGYQALLEETNKMKGNLKAEEETEGRLTQELMNLKEEFENEIARHGFTDMNAYRSSIMPSDQISKLEIAYQQFREELIRIESSISHYMELTKGKERIKTDLLEEKKRELEAEAKKLDDMAKSVYGIRSRNEAILIKLQELYDNRQKLKKEYSVISRLEATATGKAGPKRINFQTYIQRRYFISILNEANKRLYIMSNGQFILKCREIEDLANQGEVGLDLDVYSLVNDQSRDVKTLSGGESFMAALAMALGMSDVIQNTAGRVHIDTMFIDEGFGSLSDEARMQAIKILQGLSEGKRLVGIISHVTELKAQIGTKLVVTKTSKGSQARWEIME